MYVSNKKGEIITLLTVIGAIVIGLSTLVATSFLKSPKNNLATKPRAATRCDYACLRDGGSQNQCCNEELDQESPPVEEQQLPQDEEPLPQEELPAQEPPQYEPPPQQSPFQECLNQGNSPSECRGLSTKPPSQGSGSSGGEGGGSSGGGSSTLSPFQECISQGNSPSECRGLSNETFLPAEPTKSPFKECLDQGNSSSECREATENTVSQQIAQETTPTPSQGFNFFNWLGDITGYRKTTPAPEPVSTIPEANSTDGLNKQLQYKGIPIEFVKNKAPELWEGQPPQLEFLEKNPVPTKSPFQRCIDDGSTPSECRTASEEPVTFQAPSTQPNWTNTNFLQGIVDVAKNKIAKVTADSQEFIKNSAVLWFGVGSPIGGVANLVINQNAPPAGVSIESSKSPFQKCIEEGNSPSECNGTSEQGVLPTQEPGVPNTNLDPKLVKEAAKWAKDDYVELLSQSLKNPQDTELAKKLAYAGKLYNDSLKQAGYSSDDTQRTRDGVETYIKSRQTIEKFIQENGKGKDLTDSFKILNEKYSSGELDPELSKKYEQLVTQDSAAQKLYETALSNGPGVYEPGKKPLVNPLAILTPKVTPKSEKEIGLSANSEGLNIINKPTPLSGNAVTDAFNWIKNNWDSSPINPSNPKNIGAVISTMYTDLQKPEVQQQITKNIQQAIFAQFDAFGKWTGWNDPTKVTSVADSQSTAQLGTVKTPWNEFKENV